MFGLLTRKLTQEEKALKMLRRAGSHGVTHYQFAQSGVLRYGSYVKRLREEGMNIATHRDIVNGKPSNVWRYILTEEDA